MLISKRDAYDVRGGKNPEGRTDTLLRNVVRQLTFGKLVLLAENAPRGGQRRDREKRWIAMAIFHSTTKIIGRSTGRSSVAAAAYRSGQKLYNTHDGLTHDYRHRNDVVHAEILLPENAPRDYRSRSALWNAVEQSEKRVDAQTAREVELALPVELDRSAQIALIREYVQMNFVGLGMCADFAIHAGHRHRRDSADEADRAIKPDNPHAHIMLTTRAVTPYGFGKKARDWNNHKNVTHWREQWAAICNREFERRGLDARIDHRSNKERGIDREGTVHLGVDAHQMEQKGIKTDRGDINREIEKDNMSKANTPEAAGAYLRRYYAGRLADLDEMGRILSRYQSKMAQLRTQAEQLGALDFRAGEQIEEQTRQFERSLAQAAETLKREHNIAPEGVAQRRAELQRDIERYQPEPERSPEQVAPNEQARERTREQERSR
jgi:ATP-dependent exoDNAse (exonuclease V) alpha subunit